MGSEGNRGIVLGLVIAPSANVKRCCQRQPCQQQRQPAFIHGRSLSRRLKGPKAVQGELVAPDPTCTAPSPALRLLRCWDCGAPPSQDWGAFFCGGGKKSCFGHRVVFLRHTNGSLSPPYLSRCHGGLLGHSSAGGQACTLRTLSRGHIPSWEGGRIQAMEC